MPPTLPRRDLLARLVAFESVSQRSNRPLAEFICEVLERPGVRVRRLRGTAEDRLNLVIAAGPEATEELGGGLVLCGHMDVVPAGEDGWSSEPFRLTDGGDRWIGRGACDMKGFLALAMEVFAAVDPDRLRAPLVLLFTCDEEVGSLGAQALVREWPQDVPWPRSVLIGEPTELRAVRMHKGHLRLRVVTRGVSAHSGYPHRGRNAIEPAGRIVAALGELRRELETERPAGGEPFSEVPFVVLNLGRIRGGEAVNVVPEECVLELGVRTLPGMDGREVLERIRERVAGAAGDGPWELEVVNHSPPLLTPADVPLHRQLCSLLDQRESCATSFSSDGGTLQRRELQCVLYGPGSIEVAHKPDEHVPKADLEAAAGVLRELVERRCGREVGQ